MTEKYTKGESHGCVVCGKLHQLYVVYDASGKFVDCKVMSAGAKHVPNARRPLVACEDHPDEKIKAAVIRAYGELDKDNG